ncbi:MAG: hypothetical protein JF619_28570, partial [Massilia sp.]|nr:hypothetical protein [Massilia sp.]
MVLPAPPAPVAAPGGQSGTVKATVTSATGIVAADAIVAFSSSDSSLVNFKPAASAITDKTGVAVVNVVPASLTSAGATTIKAEASVSGKTGSATANIAVGAAPLTVGTLTFSPAPSGTLPAFSTLSLAIPISSGG